MSRFRYLALFVGLSVVCCLIWCTGSSPTGPSDVDSDGNESGVDSDISLDGHGGDLSIDAIADAGFDACGSLVAEAGCVMPTAVANCDAGWCRIPAGCFIMGSPPCEWGRGLYDEDQVQVTLTHDFLMAEYDTTQSQWAGLGFTNPSGLIDSGIGDCEAGNCPVGNVTWDEAVSFANAFSQSQGLSSCYALSGCTGQVGFGMTCVGAVQSGASLYDCDGYRLPTEAEWEYAARAGTTTAFYDGNITNYGADLTDCLEEPALDSIAWYCMNAGSTTHTVGGKQPNAFGLFDMSGNAMQWVNNVFTPFGYGVGPLIDPTPQIVPGTQRVVRGGLFNVWASVCRSANRFTVPLANRSPAFGFRLVRTLKSGDAGSDASDN